MQTAVVNIKVDPQVKKKAEQVAENSGYSLNIILSDYLKKIAKITKVQTRLDEEPTRYFIQSMKESEEDFKAGRVVTFKSAKDALAYLDKTIFDEPRAKKN